MNEWQPREGEEMSLREEALMLWEILSDACGLLWSGRVMDHLQCLDKELLCALFFFFKSSQWKTWWKLQRLSGGPNFDGCAWEPQSNIA